MISSLRNLGLLIALAGLVFAVQPVAADVQKIKWDDLTPKFKPLKDPLAKLDPQLRYGLQTIAWVRSLTDEQRKSPTYKAMIKDAKLFEEDFKKAKIDVDKLILSYAKRQMEMLKRERKTVAKLDNKRVQLAGYLLPLEFSAKGETDFLLVPYVGACIHVPPPPANQIVFVKTKRPFMPRGLFTPVRVTGLMATRASKRTLALADGSGKVSVGYHLKAENIATMK